MEKQMRLKTIPKIDSIEELARFCDPHDLTDFEDELHEVAESVFQPEKIIRIRISQNELETIKEIAKSRGKENS